MSETFPSVKTSASLTSGNTTTLQLNCKFKHTGSTFLLMFIPKIKKNDVFHFLFKYTNYSQTKAAIALVICFEKCYFFRIGFIISCCNVYLVSVQIFSSVMEFIKSFWCPSSKFKLKGFGLRLSLTITVREKKPSSVFLSSVISLNL